MTPLSVSVVIPVYNGERFLRESINSVVSQTFTDFEIVIVDDGSTDGSADVVRSYSDSRIRMVSHARNRGLAEARNTGIRSSRGIYVALLDSDDIAEPTRLADQFKAMEQERGLVYLGTWALIFNSEIPTATKLWKTETTDHELRALLLFRNRFNASSVMFRQNVVPSELFPNIPMAEDYRFAVAMSKLGKIANLPKPLVRYRQHAASLTVSKQNFMTEYVGKILHRQLDDFGISPSKRELEIHRHVGRLLLRSSASLLDECENWLCELSKHNDVAQHYDCHTFSEVVSKEWFEVCKHGSPAGLAAWRRYWHSNLSQAWHPSMRQRIRFLMKCLFKHRREGGDLPKVQAMQES